MEWTDATTSHRYEGSAREKKRGKSIEKRSLGTRRDGRRIGILRDCRAL
ncbi:hypothetical protein [Bacillus cereus group sp. BfR-BA-01358]